MIVIAGNQDQNKTTVIEVIKEQELDCIFYLPSPVFSFYCT